MKRSVKKPLPNIYEQPGVFGDEEKYQHATHRLDAMMSIIKGLNLKKGRVLDLGSGTGYLAALIKEQYPRLEVFGTDISKSAIKQGKKLYPKISLVASDSEKTVPYQSNYFDLVISGEHIAHLKNTDVYFSEVSRVVKKRGYLLITTPNLTSWLNRILMVCGKFPFFGEPLLNTSIPVLEVGGLTFPDPTLPPSGHLRLFNLDILVKTLTVFGLHTTRTTGVSALANRLIKPIDLLLSRIPSLASGIIILARKK